MKIRIAQEEDSETLSGLMRQLGYNTSPRLIRDKIAEISLSPIDQVFVALIEDEVIGCVTCHITQVFHQHGKAGRITSLIVSDHVRGLGIGSKLVAAADTFFQSNGCFAAELTSGEHREGAHEFYQKQGYEPSDKKRFTKYYIN